MDGITIFLFFSILFSILSTSIAVDAITANQTIRDDGNGTIESAAGVFELGFFSPNGTKNRYVGIWYKRSKTTVVWVANRQTPLTDASGELRVDANGSLVLVDGATRIIWSSNSSTSVTNNPVVAQLLDDGNLVIRYTDEIDPENYLWQSFDHPANNFLQGIKLGWDLVKGLDRHLTSWKSDADPSPGNFTFGVNLEGYPRMMLYKDSNIQFRFGPWDGVQFNGVDFIVPEQSFDAMSVSNQKEMYYSYKVLNTSVIMRMELYPNGSVEFLTWNDPNQSWEISLIAQRDACDQYALCGAYGNCDSRKSGRVDELCGCLQGYVPTFPEKWKLANWSDGCVRQTKFECGGDKFVKYSGLKLPDTRLSWFDNSMDLEDCKNMCLKNCTCTAYSNVDIRQDGTGCMLWFGDLIDVRDFSGAGLDFYVRIAASELETKRTSGSKKGVLIAVVTVLIVLLLLLLLGLLLLRKRLLRRKETLQLNPESEVSHDKDKQSKEDKVELMCCFFFFHILFSF